MLRGVVEPLGARVCRAGAVVVMAERGRPLTTRTTKARTMAIIPP